MTSRRVRGWVSLCALVAAGFAGARLAGTPARADGADASPVSVSPSADGVALPDLRWRLLGPLRSGWSTCATGVPGRPSVFYSGAADGGVWKTTDAGRT